MTALTEIYNSSISSHKILAQVLKTLILIIRMGFKTIRSKATQRQTINSFKQKSRIETRHRIE